MRVMPTQGSEESEFSAVCESFVHGFLLFIHRLRRFSQMDGDLEMNDSNGSKNNLRKSAKSVDESSALPNSKKIYVSGSLHSDLRVPFREISLAPTNTMSGEIEVNEPVRVYDTSG